MNKLKSTAKELVRHVLYKTGNYSWLYKRRTREGRDSSYLLNDSVGSRFAAIYETGVWQHGLQDGTPGSGGGSSIEVTKNLREALPKLLRDLNARTLVDIGCGDFTWMRHIDMSQNYIGLDIVDSVVASNQEKFGSGNRKFLSINAIEDEVPDGDAVLLREILFHLSLVDAKKLLRNMLRKPREVVIATSDRQTWFNADIPTGDYRIVNLQAKPFNFGRPEVVIADDALVAGRVIGVWRAQSLLRKLT